MRIRLLTAMSLVLLLALTCSLACDSSSSSGGGAAPSSSGYTIGDLAHKWKVFYPNHGYAGHTITINPDGTSTRIALEECGADGGVSKGTFTLTGDGYLVAKDVYFRCNSFPTGQYLTITYRLQVRSATLLKGVKIESLHLANGTVVTGGQDGMYMTR